jgi:hypothetical protein
MSARPITHHRSAPDAVAAAAVALWLAVVPATSTAADSPAADASRVAVPAGPTAADSLGADAPRVAGQRSFGVGPTIGFWSGVGVMAGGGGETVKAWLSGGYAPVFVFSNSRAPDRAMRFNYYGGYQLEGDVTVRVLERARTEIALLFGYKYNSVIGHGGGAGVRVLYDLSERLGLEISAGLAFFPSAQDRLDRNEGYPTDRVPPITTSLQGGANVGLLVFP